jgi:hypothetical protein
VQAGFNAAIDSARRLVLKTTGSRMALGGLVELLV